jgi:hypothetical protein
MVFNLGINVAELTKSEQSSDFSKSQGKHDIISMLSNLGSSNNEVDNLV